MNPMTQRGAERLRLELDKLKKEDRPKIIAAIQEARAHGDLSENAEYSAAKEQQSLLEGRINLLETSLAQAQVIDVTQLPQDGRVVFGVTVHLLNLDTDEKVIYELVGDQEADITENRISIGSPIARALVGKSAGEDVVVQAPQGEVEYEILKVEYLG